jgi:hypothetical protein
VCVCVCACVCVCGRWTTWHQAADGLRSPDVTVTNDSDKEYQLAKIGRLEKDVMAAFSPDAARQLLSAGSHVSELLARGFSLAALHGANVSLGDLHAADGEPRVAVELRRELRWSCAGWSCAGAAVELLAAGWSAHELRCEPSWAAPGPAHRPGAGGTSRALLPPSGFGGERPSEQAVAIAPSERLHDGTNSLLASALCQSLLLGVSPEHLAAIGVMPPELRWAHEQLRALTSAARPRSSRRPCRVRSWL